MDNLHGSEVSLKLWRRILIPTILLPVLVMSSFSNVTPSTPSVRIGTYGILSHSGQVYELDVTNWFAQSKLNWIWLEPAYPYSNLTKPAGDILKAAGKNIILRTNFWDASGIYPTYTTWSDLYNNPMSYDTCVNIISQQIDNIGRSNLYAITIGEEEPASSYKWDQSSFNVTHYTYGHNLLYDRLKTLYPTLKIFGTVHPLSWLTDTQVRDLKMDGLFTYTYEANISTLIDYLTRGLSLANQMGIGTEVYTLIYAATGNTIEPPSDPYSIAPAFEAALHVGIPNIGFYASNYEVSSRIENILFNEYTYDPLEDPKLSPYLHKVEMMSLINKYAAFTPTPTLTPTSTPVSLYWLVLGILSFCAIITFITLRVIIRKNSR